MLYIAPNGTAVEGVCVTRRSHPADDPGWEGVVLEDKPSILQDKLKRRARGLYRDRGIRR
jgi:hypothetical protein